MGKGNKMDMFKAGDKVRCIETSSMGFAGIIGKIYTVKDTYGHSSYGYTIDLEKTDFDSGYHGGCEACRFELVNAVEYEDEWHLNTGKESIPDDAEKLYNPEGTSVVAYRLRKQPNVHIQSKYFSGPPKKYVTWGGCGSDRHTRIDLIFVDDVLTDVKWEKI